MFEVITSFSCSNCFFHLWEIDAFNSLGTNIGAVNPADTLLRYSSIIGSFKFFTINELSNKISSHGSRYSTCSNVLLISCSLYRSGGTDGKAPARSFCDSTQWSSKMSSASL